MTVRMSVLICCSVLLVACDVAPVQEGQASPAQSSADGGGPPTAGPTEADAGEPTPTGGGEVDLLVSDGVRLERLENNGGQTLATVTNLNSLPVDAQVSVTLLPGGGVRSFGLTGSTTLDSGDTGSVLLQPDDGEAVNCSGGCDYDFEVQAQVAETGQEPHTNETTCSPPVCRLDEPTATATGSG